jgi:biotin carboxylase
MKISNDEPSLIEVTPRLDGCHIWRLIKYFRGIDLMDVSFKHLIGQTCAFESGRGDRSNQYALKFICEKPGKQVDKSKYDIKNALFLEWYYEEGETVQLMNGWMEKVGYYITRGS